MTLIAGRPQAPRKIKLAVPDIKSSSKHKFSLYWSYRPEGASRKKNALKLHPGDLPLSSSRRPDEFKAVFKHYIARDRNWITARRRLDKCIRDRADYGVDRLVSAANMFDILPKSAVPKTQDLPPDMLAARNEAITTFKQFSAGVDRDSVISALKRVGSPSLPKKARSRVDVVQHSTNGLFPSLETVVKTAIQVRNYFVHGSTDINFLDLKHLLYFLTDALEFVFAASDLIEAGWDASILRKAHGLTHPFCRFKNEYPESLAELQIALAKSKK